MASSAGFTLIEALIIILVLAGLASLAIPAREKYELFSKIIEIEVGVSREDQIIARLGKLDREQQTLLVFRTLHKKTNTSKRTRHGQPDAGRTAHVLVWSKDFFPARLTCHVGFDAGWKVVTAGCEG